MSPITTLVALAALVPLIAARTLDLSPRQASTNTSASEYLPPILIPQGGILWTAGANYTVTWCVRAIVEPSLAMLTPERRR